MTLKPLKLQLCCKSLNFHGMHMQPYGALVHDAGCQLTIAAFNSHLPDPMQVLAHDQESSLLEHKNDVAGQL